MTMPKITPRFGHPLFASRRFLAFNGGLSFLGSRPGLAYGWGVPNGGNSISRDIRNRHHVRGPKNARACLWILSVGWVPYPKQEEVGAVPSSQWLDFRRHREEGEIPFSCTTDRLVTRLADGMLLGTSPATCGPPYRAGPCHST